MSPVDISREQVHHDRVNNSSIQGITLRELLTLEDMPDIPHVKRRRSWMRKIHYKLEPYKLGLISYTFKVLRGLGCLEPPLKANCTRVMVECHVSRGFLFEIFFIRTRL